MVECTCQFALFYIAYGIAAPYPAERPVAVLAKHGVDDEVGAVRKWSDRPMYGRRFCHAHGTVPDHGIRQLDAAGNESAGKWSDIQDHFVFSNGTAAFRRLLRVMLYLGNNMRIPVYDTGRGFLVNQIRYYAVLRDVKHKPLFLGLLAGLGQQVFGHGYIVRLVLAFGNVDTFCSQK